MAPSVIRPLFGKNPEFYRMSCTKCGWEDAFELEPCETITIALPGTPPDRWHHVTELPRRCPKCGARLKKEKLPITVWN